MQNRQKLDHAVSEKSGSLGSSYDPGNEFVEFKREEIEQSIPDRFEQQVRLYPHHLAVKSENCTLTYDELNKAANQIARAILAQRGEGEEPIALLFEHEASVIIAIIAALKAGKPYVALDPSYPQTRLAHTLANLQTELIVTNNNNLPLAAELAQNVCQLVNIDEVDFSDENLGLSISPDTLAAIFFTSGSTGRPKGVERNHRNILQRIRFDAIDYKIRPDDCLSLLLSCNFAASTSDTFSALLNGATLCRYNVKELGIDHLAKWLSQEEISLFHPPITLFRQFLDTLTGTENFPKVRLITLSGQALYKRDVERFRQYFSPDCILAHRISASEASIIRRFKIDHKTVITDNVVPVGYAVEDKEILILDEAGQELGFNQVGQIAVRSRYLAPGYWRRPDLTQAKFLPDPEGGDKRIYLTGDLGRMRPDGCLEHFGRKDFQVKVRGYRVELMEIEGLLHNLELVEEAVVVAQEDQVGNRRLVAYLVPSKQPVPTVSLLRSTLAENLPDYMVPSSFVMLEKLPLTPNGKVDRNALPIPTPGRPELKEVFVAPQTLIEKQLAGLWSDILKIEPVGINDNFFELGGQSLLAAQTISKVRATFQVELRLRTLFDNPTVAALAREIEKVMDRDANHLNGTQEEYNLEDALRMLGDF